MNAGYGLTRLLRRARDEGPRTIAQRAARRAYQRLGAGTLEFPLLPGDIADSRALAWSPPLDDVQTHAAVSPLTVGWLTTPPSAGSGGHTTMLRAVEAVERAGHRCVILLYDRHRGDLQAQTRAIRDAWPSVTAEVQNVPDDLEELDACVATSWPTAHVLAVRARRPLRCLYFIQDYEPFFYPHGVEYQFAEDTYRFGFTHVALGHMVRRRLRTEAGVSSHLVPFSCDTAVYSRTNTGQRSGVVFYTKPSVARRGYQLGALALEEFHRRHPEQAIHVYGDAVPDLAVPVTRHARMTPRELNRLYNASVAGLAMSFTNISLVAEEMLAAGCIPVVNDSTDSRADLDNPHVEWAPPTPGGLADALSAAVQRVDLVAHSSAAAASVRQDNWHAAGQGVVDILEGRIG